MPPSGLAIIIGAGPTTGAGIARILSSPGYGNLAVALLSRTGDANLAETISKSCYGGAGTLRAFRSDTSETALKEAFESIGQWKAELDATHKTDLKLHLGVFNIKHSHKTPFEEETAARFGESMSVYVTGAMIFSQLSLKWMMGQYGEADGADGATLQKRGTLIFTSTLGSLRTNANFAAYGATRASVRMLAQSLAREYSGRGVHVVHAIANGGITDKGTDDGGEDRAKVLKGERIQAESVGRLYLSLMQQGCDLWVHELDMRPAAEKF